MTVTAEPVPSVDEALEKARDGERITDEDAIALLRSRDLVAVGRVANEIRSRMTSQGADPAFLGSDDFATYGAHARSLMAFVGTGDQDGGLHDATFLPDDGYVALVADALVAGYAAAVG